MNYDNISPQVVFHRGDYWVLYQRGFSSSGSSLYRGFILDDVAICFPGKREWLEDQKRGAMEVTVEVIHGNNPREIVW
jgi:hypothetical protein